MTPPQRETADVALKRMRTFSLVVSGHMLALPVALAAARLILEFEADRWQPALAAAAGTALVSAVVSLLAGPRILYALTFPILFVPMMLCLGFLVRNGVQHPLAYMLFCALIASMVVFHFSLCAWGSINGRPKNLAA